MSVACIGTCCRGPKACPKHRPPAFNPNPCWLLDCLYDSSHSPELPKWDLVRRVAGPSLVNALCLKPVRIEFNGQSEQWDRDSVHGALSLPCGTRLLSRELSPGELIRAAGVISKALAGVQFRAGAYLAEATILYLGSLERVIEIAECAEECLGFPKRLVLVYGW